MPTRLLIVDDDRFVRSILKDLLAADGYDFSECGDGLEAVEQVRSDPPDLVLLDLFMPKMSGLEALQEIRKAEPAQKVVVISSLDSEPLVQQALDAGAAGFVVKPFHPLEIKSAIKKALRPGA